MTYKGSYEPDQLPAILAGFDAAIVPSLMENYPLVVLEAFMSGTPVVASRAGGIPEVVTHERNGLLFDTGNADDLARQLQSIVANPALLGTLRSNILPTRTIADDAVFYAEMYQQLSGASTSTPREEVRAR